MRASQLSLLLSVLVPIAACGDAGGGSTPDAAGGGDGGNPDGTSSCPRTAAAADRTRYVVVGRPYDTAGAQASTFEVLELSATGTLTRPSPQRIFSLGGRAAFGTIAFTPDGEVGLVALDNGKLASFTLDASGTPTVVEAALASSFYADRIVVDPAGDRAWIVDGNTRDNGGGVYLVTIGCDGSLADRGKVAAAKSPGGLALVGDHAVLAAGDALTSTTPGNDVHLLQWGDAPSLTGGADAFGDDNAIVGGSALTHDGSVFLVGDTSGFSGVPNRVAVVGVSATAVTPISVVTPIEDPQGIATSPFGNVAIVTSAFGDAIFVLDTGGAGGAWRLRGEVAYAGAGPQLPGDLATIARGQLAGSVLVSENVSVRRLIFRASGMVEDAGSLAFGSGLQNITGAIGVTP